MDWHPKDDNLTRVAEYRDSECYEWYITALWHDPAVDRYYLYEGAGCSCNEPYEDYQGVADMQEIQGLGHLMRSLDIMDGRDKGKFLGEYMEFERTKGNRAWS